MGANQFLQELQQVCEGRRRCYLNDQISNEKLLANEIVQSNADLRLMKLDDVYYVINKTLAPLEYEQRICIDISSTLQQPMIIDASTQTQLQVGLTRWQQCLGDVLLKSSKDAIIDLRGVLSKQGIVFGQFKIETIVSGYLLEYPVIYCTTTDTTSLYYEDVRQYTVHSGDEASLMTFTCPLIVEEDAVQKLLNEPYKSSKRTRNMDIRIDTTLKTIKYNSI
ncbi:hypothetical protein MIR68_006784 [Amoeboaphelidium protococcarum]|nr:hypothetical protein MIR68_006784 [Amoeboaphelidium protococcarum]